MDVNDRSAPWLSGNDGWDDDWWDDSRWDDEPDRPDLGLSAAQQASLAAALHAALRERGCDNTLRAARAWAATSGTEWTALRTRLEGRGGFCDCEVVFNALDSG